MSTAQKAMAEVLSEHVGCRLSTDHIRRLSFQLLPVVRDAVARGFEEAARQFESHPDVDDVVPGLLHRWATEARTANPTTTEV